MSSRNMRLCPGVSNRKCGVYMSPVQIDSHPMCARCRGRNCTSDSTCSTCEGWSLGQWKSFNKKRSYADCKKYSKRHAGDPTSLASETTCSAAPIKQAATSHAPLSPSLPPPSPPLSEGHGMGKRRIMLTLSIHMCVCVYTPPPRAGWGGTDSELTEGEPPPLPPLRRGKGWTQSLLSHLP